MMLAAKFEEGCSPESMSLFETEIPQPRAGEILIKVYATAVNRADTLQRKGLYPAPQGESQLLGLEAAGKVHSIPVDTSCDWRVGDRVMALVSGGGNAQYVTARASHIMKIPSSMTYTEAAAIPEVWLTAFQLLNRLGKIEKCESVLAHAAASGVGTAVIQLVTKVYEGNVIGTVGSDTKAQFIREMGAQHAINYKTDKIDDQVKLHTDGRGVHIVLDCVGGNFWQANANSLRVEGRWVLYGLLSGPTVEGPLLAQILRKRLRIEGTSLRARSDQYKADLISDFCKDVLPSFQSGTLRPVIDRVLPFSEIGRAHKTMENNENMGKIVLRVCDEE